MLSKKLTLSHIFAPNRVLKSPEPHSGYTTAKLPQLEGFF